MAEVALPAWAMPPVTVVTVIGFYGFAVWIGLKIAGRDDA